MNPQYIKVKGKMSADTFGCSEAYFKKHIKGKPLLIVQSTPSHYVRAQDENHEEWGLFPGQYALCTGLESPNPQQSPEAAKEKLPG